MISELLLLLLFLLLLLLPIGTPLGKHIIINVWDNQHHVLHMYHGNIHSHKTSHYDFQRVQEDVIEVCCHSQCYYNMSKKCGHKCLSPNYMEFSTAFGLPDQIFWNSQ